MSVLPGRASEVSHISRGGPVRFRSRFLVGAHFVLTVDSVWNVPVFEKDAAA